MIDLIPPSEPGLDSGTYDTQNYRAANILAVQLGALEYAQDLGIDLRYFLSENFKFQNESFKSYCVEVLANQGINVSEVLESKDKLFSQFEFLLTPQETTTGLVAG